MAKLAFIGLGTMGYYMAGHLQQRHEVCVYNRTASKAQEWCDTYGGSCAASPCEAAQGCDAVFTCVGNDDDLRSVVLGANGALAGLERGAALIDHTTTSATLAKELDAACRDAAVDFMDAPVSGGSEGAQHGRLTVMCGATESAFARLAPLLESYAAKSTLIGEVGSGQAAKMVNQICVIGALQGLAEGLHLARTLGLEASRVIEAISQGAAGSWQMDNRWQSMTEGRFTPGFAVKWMTKDLDICLKEADNHQTQLPLAQLVDGFYHELSEQGLGEEDITRLISRL